MLLLVGTLLADFMCLLALNKHSISKDWTTFFGCDGLKWFCHLVVWWNGSTNYR
jgi:hypothetical protein